MSDCKHEWVVIGGGEPEYKVNKSSSVRTDEPVVQVECKHCGARTWLTKEEFEGVSVEEETVGSTEGDSAGSGDDTGSVDLGDAGSDAADTESDSADDSESDEETESDEEK